MKTWRTSLALLLSGAAALNVACDVPEAGHQPDSTPPVVETQAEISAGTVVCALWVPCAVNAALLGFTTPHKNDISRSLEWAAQQPYKGADRLRGWLQRGLGARAAGVVNILVGNPLGALGDVRTVTVALKGALQNVKDGPALAERAYERIKKGGLDNVVLGVTDLYMSMSLVNTAWNPDVLLTLAQESFSNAQMALGLEGPGRKLTTEEIDVLRPIFGNNLNYGEIVIKTDHSGLYSAFFEDRPFTAQNVIYFKKAENYSLKTLVHEVTHVWQYKQVGTRYKIEALVAGFVPGFEEYNWVNAVNDGLRFDDMNPEQQASLIDDGWQYVATNGRKPLHLNLEGHFVGPTDPDLGVRRFAEGWNIVSGGASVDRYAQVGIHAKLFSTATTVCIVPLLEDAHRWPKATVWAPASQYLTPRHGPLNTCTYADMGVWPAGYHHRADDKGIYRVTGNRACHVNADQWAVHGSASLRFMDWAESASFKNALLKTPTSCTPADFRAWAPGLYRIADHPDIFHLAANADWACWVNFDQWVKLGTPQPTVVPAGDRAFFEGAFGKGSSAPCTEGRLGIKGRLIE